MWNQHILLFLLFMLKKVVTSIVKDFMIINCRKNLSWTFWLITFHFLPWLPCWLDSSSIFFIHPWLSVKEEEGKRLFTFAKCLFLSWSRDSILNHRLRLFIPILNAILHHRPLTEYQKWDRKLFNRQSQPWNLNQGRP
jgi:hypothetical protein